MWFKEKEHSNVKTLLAESELTWKRAIKIAQAMESMEKQANNFRTTPVVEQVSDLRHEPMQAKVMSENNNHKTAKSVSVMVK